MNRILILFVFIIIPWGSQASTLNKIHAVITSESTAMISSPMDGYIKKLKIKDGSQFKKNQLLVEFDCRVQQAEQKKALSEVSLSKLNLRSQTRLHQLGSASKLNIAEAKAQHQKAMAELEITNKKVDDCSIEAPFDGQIIELFVHQHETISLNQKVFKILSNQDLSVKVLIPSSWLGQVSVGTEFKLYIKENNKTYAATIVRISNHVDAISQSVKAIAKVKDHSLSLKSGMSGDAIFPGIGDAR